MSLNAVKMLEISVTNSSKIDILEEMKKYLDYRGKKTQKSLKIFTPNTEQLVYAAKNRHFADILNQADVALPDGIGVVWAGRMLTKNGPKTVIPGVEFMEDLVRIAANRHVPIGLIGGEGKVAVEAFECLQKKYPGLTTSLNPRVIFVALGAPKQEYFIAVAAKKTPGIIFMAVGGSFDIIAGRLPRAPVFFRKLGLEWFWRLLLQPWRIFRQLALIEFVLLVVREKLSRGTEMY